MPTIAWILGLRVVIYFNDHRPAHVHVIGGGCEAVFLLQDPEGRLLLYENYGFRRQQVARIKRALRPLLPALRVAWMEIHGSE